MNEPVLRQVANAAWASRGTPYDNATYNQIADIVTLRVRRLLQGLTEITRRRVDPPPSRLRCSVTSRPQLQIEAFVAEKFDALPAAARADPTRERPAELLRLPDDGDRARWEVDPRVTVADLVTLVATDGRGVLGLAGRRGKETPVQFRALVPALLARDTERGAGVH